MKAKILDWYAALSAREQRIVLLGAVVVLLTMVVMIVMPLRHSVLAAEARVEQKRADLLWLRSMAPQLAGLQASSSPSSQSHDSLIALIARTAGQAGLSKNLVGSQASGDGLSVRFEQISFDALIAWLSQLRQNNGVRVDTATIDAASAVGTVNASLLLRSH